MKGKMPPKKVSQVPNKKTVEKKKDKVIEVSVLVCFGYSWDLSVLYLEPPSPPGYPMHGQDKTFGIKNKKGKKQQVFIKQVTNQVKFGGGQSVSKVSTRPCWSKLVCLRAYSGMVWHHGCVTLHRNIGTL